MPPHSLPYSVCGAWVPSHPCSRLLPRNPDFCHQTPQGIPSSACLGLPPPASVLEPELCSALRPRPAFLDLKMLLLNLWCCDSRLSRVQSTPSSCSPQGPPALVTPVPQMPLPSLCGPILQLPWLPVGEQLFFSTLLPKSPAGSPPPSPVCVPALRLFYALPLC